MARVDSEDLAFFKTVAANRSLADAARLLGVSPAAVTQRLQHVEARLGARLIERSGRRLVLTDEGAVVLKHARTLLAGLDELEEELDARHGLLAGTLRVLAPIGFGRAYVAPVVAAIRAGHPALAVDLSLSDRVGRLTDEAWDVAIHIGALADSGLSRQTLAPNERWLCATPGYLAAFGTPRDPAELKRHACIVLRENDKDVTYWRFTCGRDGSAIRIDPALATNDGDVAKAWCLEGQGIILRSEWHVADDVAAGRLVRLLPEFLAPNADVLALIPARGTRSKRVDTFVSRIRKALRPIPWRRDEAPGTAASATSTSL